MELEFLLISEFLPGLNLKAQINLISFIEKLLVMSWTNACSQVQLSQNKGGTFRILDGKNYNWLHSVWQFWVDVPCASLSIRIETSLPFQKSNSHTCEVALKVRDLVNAGYDITMIKRFKDSDREVVFAERCDGYPGKLICTSTRNHKRRFCLCQDEHGRCTVMICFPLQIALYNLLDLLCSTKAKLTPYSGRCPICSCRGFLISKPQ